MLSTLPNWHTKPTASPLTLRDRLHHYKSRTIPITHKPFMPIGSFAISTTSPHFAKMFMTLNDANAAVAAYTEALSNNDSERWRTAAERFEKLEPFSFETNAEEDSKANLNLATVCDNKTQISNACTAVQMYYTPANHLDSDKLREMEDINVSAGEFALLDSTKIRGRRTIVECENNLKSADEAMPEINSDDADMQRNAIEKYKLHASVAVTLAKMVPDQMKNESFEELQKRVNSADEMLKQYYSDDYDKLMREASLITINS